MTDDDWQNADELWEDWSDDGCKRCGAVIVAIKVYEDRPAYREADTLCSSGCRVSANQTVFGMGYIVLARDP